MNRYVIVAPFVDAPVTALGVSKRIVTALEKLDISQVSQLCIRLVSGEKLAGIGAEGLKELEAALNGKYVEVHSDDTD